MIEGRVSQALKVGRGAVEDGQRGENAEYFILWLRGTVGIEWVWYGLQHWLKDGIGTKPELGGGEGHIGLTRTPSFQCGQSHPMLFE